MLSSSYGDLLHLIYIRCPYSLLNRGADTNLNNIEIICVDLLTPPFLLALHNEAFLCWGCGGNHSACPSFPTWDIFCQKYLLNLLIFQIYVTFLCWIFFPSFPIWDILCNFFLLFSNSNQTFLIISLFSDYFLQLPFITFSGHLGWRASSYLVTLFVPASRWMHSIALE